MKDAPRVLIIGYGEMGHAMEYLLAGRCDLQVWTRHPVPGHKPVALAAAVSTASVILYCIPVTPLADVAQRVLPTLQAGGISLSIAKGLDFGVLYGPMISEEIRAGRPAFAQFAGSQPAVFDIAGQLFAGSGLVLQSSRDMTGISWASVLKNVYAMLFGAADELGLGDNVRGYLVVACLEEMQMLVGKAGGEPLSAAGLAGLGDLVTTATSEDSHHHALGRLLARKQLDNISGEGVHTLAMGDGIIRDPEDIGARLLATVESITGSRCGDFYRQTQ